MPSAPVSNRLAELFELITSALTEIAVEESITKITDEGTECVVHRYRLALPVDSDAGIKHLSGVCDYVLQILKDPDKIDSLPVGAAVLAPPLCGHIETLRRLCDGIEFLDREAVFPRCDDEYAPPSGWETYHPKHEKDNKYENAPALVEEVISSAMLSLNVGDEPIETDSSGLATQITDIQRVLTAIDLSDRDKNDMNFTLSEIATCTQNGCYIAAIALCGRCLERALWLLLDTANVSFNRDKDGIQKLWEKLTHPKNVEKLPERAKTVFKQPQQRELLRIVQRYRNACAHATDDPLFPSLAYVTTVVGALGVFWENTASMLDESC